MLSPLIYPAFPFFLLRRQRAIPMRTTTTRTTTPVKELDWWRTLNTGSSETSREGGSSCRVDYPLLIIQTHYWLPVPGRPPPPPNGGRPLVPQSENLAGTLFFLVTDLTVVHPNQTRLLLVRSGALLCVHYAGIRVGADELNLGTSTYIHSQQCM